eukprot:9081599-Karenia_brevis.AAC.1
MSTRKASECRQSRIVVYTPRRMRGQVWDKAEAGTFDDISEEDLSVWMPSVLSRCSLHKRRTA